MTVKPPQELLDKYQKEIDSISSTIDPNDEYDWRGITLGWALANGLDPSQNWETDEEAARNAHNFSIYVRYDTDMAG